MIISPPFLPDAGLSAPTGTNPDPMMDAVDKFECAHGVYPIAFDRRWHCGVHLQPDTKGKVYAIADGEVVAYRVCQHAIDGGASHTGFVLLKHTTETGDGRPLTFYSLYMHLLPLVEYQQHSANANEMPEFLRMPTGDAAAQVPPAEPGKGNKVKRKDVLGWLGQYEGMPHLHFEIFMMPADFDAYFGHTQLGNATPTPPAGTDWWGHAYFVIPAGRSFLSLPTGAVTDAHQKHKLHGIEFELGQAGSNNLPLLVETYFGKGAKYTNVWTVEADGTRTLLTSQPVPEADYEYDLYKRATALYPTCPSDGYELLRFGRILSTPQTLAADVRVTWMKVTWASGQVGYIDINDANIHKFSDADFLSFMGWQKVSDSNTPFGSDGLCDVGALKKLLNDAWNNHETALEQPQTTEAAKADAIFSLKSNEQVRHQLRGFVCQAPSEWDSTHNEQRYAKLLDKGEFYDGNMQGYNDFLKYLKEVQFWDKTGLPAGQKLWFFHPLAFIRHFRRCDWLSLQEQIQLLPRNSISDAGSQISWVESKKRFTEGNSDARGQSPQGMWLALNHMFLKYGFNSSLRKAHFLGQIFKETGALCSTRENGNADYFRKMYENYTASDAAYDFDNKYNWLKNLGFLKNRDRAAYIAQRPGEVHKKAVAGENTQPGDGARFCGRGLIHLTWRKSYREYGEYRDKDFTTDPNPTLLQADAETAADSAGYFWVKTRINRKADHGSSNTDVQGCFSLVGGAGGLPARQQFFRYTYFILGEAPDMQADSTLERQKEG
ncbi:M23 family metallopeptidase [Paraburkholderia phenazinium]|uniref:Predicted chitinase n=1 Tax=Paraburkholderia phenazinium TaxID=60549 RepID=A0A1G7S9L2_9BURK|nr:M23 family metallopeptidase [Paraburkholderia phenazinium]SDG19735.1 Predicted chitinase [Paraburkholderia phenazinium]